MDFVKNPIIIRNSNNHEIFSEKALKKLILEDIELVINELGNSFSFIGSEYKIRLDNTFRFEQFQQQNIYLNQTMLKLNWINEISKLKR